MLPVNSSGGGELAYRYEFCALSAVPLITVFGNVLVVVAVIRERHLKTSTNFLLVSLAIADLLVAICVMPFAIYLLVSLYCLSLSILSWIDFIDSEKNHSCAKIIICILFFCTHLSFPGS